MEKDHYVPRKIVYYPIQGDRNGGALFLFGKEESNRICFLSAGWPDDHEIFLPLACRLAKEMDALVGVTCLPGFDDRDDKPWIEHFRDKPDGYTFDEMSNCFREASKALLKESSCSRPKITGIFHDWGVFPGTMWANRAVSDQTEFKPDELILFDVLLSPNPKTKDLPHAPSKTTYQLLCEILYKIVFAFSFWLQRYVGKLAAAILFRIGSICLFAFRLLPLGRIDYQSRRQIRVGVNRRIYMCYPYANLIGLIFRNIRLGRRTLDEDMYLSTNFSSLPVLYLYGTKKRATFHDNVSLKLLEKEGNKTDSKSNAIAVNAGHWLYVQKADECFEHIRKFMQT